jgi:hypothetical protein
MELKLGTEQEETGLLGVPGILSVTSKVLHIAIVFLTLRANDDEVPPGAVMDGAV